jgi:hypothetical protein
MEVYLDKNNKKRRFPIITTFGKLKKHDVFKMGSSINIINNSDRLLFDCVSSGKWEGMEHIEASNYKQIYLRKRRRLIMHYDKDDICELTGDEWWDFPVVIIKNQKRTKEINKQLEISSIELDSEIDIIKRKV